MKSRPEQAHSLKARALKYLARREYSCAELWRKLQPYAECSDQLSQLIDELVSDGYLSDQRAGQQIIRSYQQRYGLLRIRQMLDSRQIDPELVADELEQLSQQQLELARQIWQKKYTVADSMKEQARQMRFLQSRGFDSNIIRQIFKTRD